MKTQKFEDLKICRDAHDIAYYLCKLVRSEKLMSEYAMNNQLTRAVISISCNIAEGHQRQTKREFRQFLYVAKGSCAETRSLLYLYRRLDLINEADFNNFLDKLRMLSSSINRFIFRLNQEIIG